MDGRRDSRHAWPQRTPAGGPPPLNVLKPFSSSNRRPPIPFDPQHVVHDLAEHDRARAHHLIGAGVARWRNREQTAWSYTLGGSIRVSRETAKIVQAGIRMATEPEREERLRPL